MQAGINQYLSDIIGSKFSTYRNEYNRAQAFELETEFPLYLSLETQLKCNFKCGMCAYSIPEEMERMQYSETMTDEMFRRIVSEASEYNCPSMGFNTMNEPLMDAKIIDRILMADQQGIFDTRMNSNGSLLTESRSKKIVDSGLTRLMIGIDAATEATYRQVRVGGNFIKLMRNIERFLNIREKITRNCRSFVCHLPI
jgi:MoaA/NifB/PqqE/SkfB family radical SAM enzyme